MTNLSEQKEKISAFFSILPSCNVVSSSLSFVMSVAIAASHTSIQVIQVFAEHSHFKQFIIQSNEFD